MASLGPVRRPLIILAFAALSLGCGDAGEGLLNQRQAETLLSAVDDVERALGADDCDAAEDAASSGRAAALELPNRVDDRLKRNLSDWFEHLETRVRRECEDEPEQEPTQEPTPEPTEEPTPEPTQEPTPTPEPTPPPTTDPTPTPPPDGTGGSEAPDEGDG